MRKQILFGIVMFCISSMNAKTVAWYRFEEFSQGTVAVGETRFTNTVDEAKYPAYARVCTANGNNKFKPEKPTVLTTTAERMPAFVNAFPANVSIYDPVTLEEYSNKTGIDTRNLPGTKDNPSGLILIDDHEDLRMKSFSLEFFMRCNDATEGFRTFVVRTSSTYSSGEAFRIYGQLYSSGKMYVVGELKTDVIDAQSGKPTLYKINASSENAIVDDNLWHHIAITVDNEKKEAIIYIDYIKRGSVEFEGEINYDHGYPFTFGGDVQCSYYNSNTQFDEIRFSDKVLLPEEFLHYGYSRISQSNAYVDDNTLFFFDFNDAFKDEIVGEGVMKENFAINRFLENKAKNPLFKRFDAILYASKQVENYAMPENLQDVPNAGCRFGILGKGKSTNTSSCFITTNDLVCTNGKKIVLPEKVTREELFSESLTIEAFIKIPKASDQAGFNNALPTAAHLLSMNNTFTISMAGNPAAWNYGYVQASIGTTTLQNNGELPSHTYLSKKGYADGNWHHIALVYDKEFNEGCLYVDGVLVLSADGSFTFNNMVNSYHKNFIIGDSYWPEHFSTALRIDDVRITRGALKPYQFLTTIEEEDSAVYAKVSFENDLIMQPYASFFTSLAELKQFTEDGEKPTFGKQRPAREILKGKDGSAVLERNSWSLRINGGCITYPSRNLFAAQDTFTYEMFIKAKTINSGAGIARVNLDKSHPVCEDVIWALSFANGQGDILLKLDTFSCKGQTHTFNTALGTDRFHHIAMRVSVIDGNTNVEMYKDHKLVGTKVFEGKIIVNPRNINFTLGAGEVPNAAFDGWIDEIRLTPDILKVEDFMYPKVNGFSILVK